MLIALGGMDAVVATALGGVLRSETPMLKISMEADFKQSTQYQNCRIINFIAKENSYGKKI